MAPSKNLKNNLRTGTDREHSEGFTPRQNEEHNSHTADANYGGAPVSATLAPAPASEHPTSAIDRQAPDHTVAAPASIVARTLNSNVRHERMEIGETEPQPAASTINDEDADAANILLSLFTQARVGSQTPVQTPATSPAEVADNDKHAEASKASGKRKFHTVHWSDSEEGPDNGNSTQNKKSRKTRQAKGKGKKQSPELPAPVESSENVRGRRPLHEVEWDEDEVADANTLASDGKKPGKKAKLRQKAQPKLRKKAPQQKAEKKASVGEDEAEESEVEDNEVEASAGAKTYHFELATPEEGRIARSGQQDESLFTITFRRLNGPNKGELQSNNYVHANRAKFDWDNKDHIYTLNTWRWQRRLRLTGPQKNSNLSWTVTDVDVLFDVVTEHMERVQNSRRLDWELIASDFNDRLRGRWVEIGEVFASSMAPTFRLDPFGEPEEDPKKGRQATCAQRRYMCKDRTDRAINAYARKVPSIKAVLDQEFGDPEDSLTDPSDDSGDDSDASSYDYGEGTKILIATTRRRYPQYTGIRGATRLPRRFRRMARDDGNHHNEGPGRMLNPGPWSVHRSKDIQALSRLQLEVDPDNDGQFVLVPGMSRRGAKSRDDHGEGSSRMLAPTSSRSQPRLRLRDEHADSSGSVSTMPPRGTGIREDPANYVAEGWGVDEREARLYTMRQATKDRAGEIFWKGG